MNPQHFFFVSCPKYLSFSGTLFHVVLLAVQLASSELERAKRERERSLELCWRRRSTMVAMGPSRYSKLQNGSDVRGVALGKPEAVTLTANRVRNIAHAFAKILKQRAGKEGTGGVRIGVEPWCTV